MNWQLWRIDWPNHTIGFFSALFGIVIAFELDQCRDAWNEKQLSAQAFNKLQSEIEINQNLLHETVVSNLRHLATLRQVVRGLDADMRFRGTIAAADSINQHFDEVIFIEIDSALRQSNVKGLFNTHIALSNITLPALQTSAWESSKATGALNSMTYEKVAALSFIYNHVKISDELREIREHWRKADAITTRDNLLRLVHELERSHHILQRELTEYDQYVNMVEMMN
jgi:hypothetical protein